MLGRDPGEIVNTGLSGCVHDMHRALLVERLSALMITAAPAFSARSLFMFALIAPGSITRSSIRTRSSGPMATRMFSSGLRGIVVPSDRFKSSPCSFEKEATTTKKSA